MASVKPENDIILTPLARYHTCIIDSKDHLWVLVPGVFWLGSFQCWRMKLSEFDSVERALISEEGRHARRFSAHKTSSLEVCGRDIALCRDGQNHVPGAQAKVHGAVQWLKCMRGACLAVGWRLFRNRGVRKGWASGAADIRIVGFGFHSLSGADESLALSCPARLSPILFEPFQNEGEVRCVRSRVPQSRDKVKQT